MSKLRALGYAVDLLMQARFLREQGDDAAVAALILLQHSNPTLVSWLCYTLNRCVTRREPATDVSGVPIEGAST